MISTYLPGLFRRVTMNMIHGGSEDSELSADLDLLIKKYSYWAVIWGARNTQSRVSTTSSGYFALFEAALTCKYLGYYAMCNRLRVVLSSSSQEAAEARAIRAAREILALGSHLRSPTVAGLGIVLSMKVARSILNDSNKWLSLGSEPEAKVALFHEWCSLLDRAT